MDQEPRIVGDLSARFWSKVGMAEAFDCWPWLASLNDGGYGQFAIDGKPHRAHRVAWELLRGEIPDGLVIDHLCRNRVCVNPWHLEPVSNEENIRRGDHTTNTYNSQKVKCRNGHDYSEENTRITLRGERRCRICERKQSLTGYYARKARGRKHIYARTQYKGKLYTLGYFDTREAAAEAVRVKRQELAST